MNALIRINNKTTHSFAHSSRFCSFIPDTNVTKVSNLHALLQLCTKDRTVTDGKACHAKVFHFGLQQCTLTSNLLINCYSKSGLVLYARRVFDEMPDRSLVSWNTMIGSYTQTGEEQQALSVFIQMHREGNTLNEFTVSSVLCACAANCAVFVCKQLHGFAIKAAIDSNVYVGTGLLGVYAKCGYMNEATQIFELMGEKSAVTWSSMVAGYVENELYEEALVLFNKAQAKGLELNQYTISSVICACANLAALVQGKQVHSVLCKTGFFSNVFVASALIDMYAKCGSVREAYIIFSGVDDNKNDVLWNAMISGFAKHGRSMEAVILFEKMQQKGTHPNEVTYNSILSACSHMGLVEKGRRYFDLMKSEYKLSPNALHYSCMVDILGRAGLTSEARDLIETMPFDATASMWGSLLSSCRVHGDLDLAGVAAKQLLELEPDNAGNHVLLSNLYAANKKWDEVAKARKLIKDSVAKKVKGKSWLEIKNEVHTFMVGEINHPRIGEIYMKLKDLVEDMKKYNYKFETEQDLHDVDESKKQELLMHHSEKLAFTFGLMCLPLSAPIRIMKNLRICIDCHSFMKVASIVTQREIIVRDVNRFHHFNNGCCSCGDFW